MMINKPLVLTYLYLLIYIVLSSGVILYNKWIWMARRLGISTIPDLLGDSMIKDHLATPLTRPKKVPNFLDYNL
ncbi:hypothetical protein CK203_001650 [Vitis vinifera]|uniref:Uncharacterized protein n=1 Tax=Vitis vinifera TaxID=29760 RepID=A0A438F7L6_VITVI|nr:hypothetical protein CK203_078788 [Vitis vinifera]RVX22248.1 hypothetical protein CK203_001650 [Vitis vinifera]